MIVHASVVIAVLRNESDAIAIGQAQQPSPICRLSAVTHVGAGVVTDNNRDPVLSRRVDDLIRDVRTRIEPVTVQPAQIARQAYRDFGKGGRKPGLYLGDCFAYALAKDLEGTVAFQGIRFQAHRHRSGEVLTSKPQAIPRSPTSRGCAADPHRIPCGLRCDTPAAAGERSPGSARAPPAPAE